MRILKMSFLLFSTLLHQAQGISRLPASNILTLQHTSQGKSHSKVTDMQKYSHLFLISSQAVQRTQVNLLGSWRTIIKSSMDSEYYWLSHNSNNLSPTSLQKTPQTPSVQRSLTCRVQRNVRRHFSHQEMFAPKRLLNNPFQPAK